MIELKGQCASAKIFAESVENSAMSQIHNIINHPAFQGEKIRIMPDVHAGIGCVIGLTSTYSSRIIPNVVGVDIGCGVTGWKLPVRNLDFQELHDFICARIPCGHGIRKHTFSEDDIPPEATGLSLEEIRNFLHDIRDVCRKTGQDENYAFRSIGSLGGGNHFIEIDRDENGDFWLTIHSGSRNFGLKTANFHQKKAVAECGKMGGLEYLEDESAAEYLRDMRTAQGLARLNRLSMGYSIIKDFFRQSQKDYLAIEMIESVHNYISIEERIVRKGAISAQKEKPLIIPWNMRDGLVIGVGKGNADWNSSAPHGAGRRMSRREAKDSIPLDSFKNAMRGIWSKTVNRSTLDEAPHAYKNHREIRKSIEPTVDIRHVLKPVYNLKDDTGNLGRAKRRDRKRGRGRR